MRRVRPSLPSARLPRLLHVTLVVIAALGVSLFAAACGKQGISVPTSDPANQGAVLFNQHCSGCHSLSAAAANGSAANPRTKEYENGPNFNVRCERPLARILYAIANGGFSGAIMPQNIVVGQDAVAVAEFVARYAGHAAPVASGVPSCSQKPIGTVPNYSAATNTTQGQSGPSNAQMTTTTATATTNNPAGAPPSSTTSSSGANKTTTGAKKTKKASGKSPGG